MSLEQPDLSRKSSVPEEDIFRELYTVASEDHPLYEKYQPKFLKNGGQHLVYTLPDHPKIVFKVRYDVLAKYLPQYVSEEPSGKMAIEDRLSAHTDFEKEKLARMAQYFGKEHMVRERLNVMNLPFPESLVRDILQEKTFAVENGTIELPVLTRIQEKLEIDPAHVLDICTGYAEKNIPEDGESKRLYREGSERWVFGDSSDGSFDARLFEKTQRSPSLNRLISHALSKPELRAVVEDFLKKAIAYGMETGGILDLAGSNNVIVIEENGGGKYKIVDGAYPGNDRGALQRGYEAFLKGGVRKEDLAPDEMSILSDVLNYVRSINGMAEAIGLEERIKFVNDSGEKGQIDWERLRGLLAHTA